MLGPLLFLGLINYVHNDIEVPIKVFADDCILQNSETSVDDQIRLNNALLKIGERCSTWQMKINHEKTVMSITNKKVQLIFHYSVILHKKGLSIQISGRNP